MTIFYYVAKFSRMNSTTRYLKAFLQEDLKNKMVFLGGPPHVGKTTLANELVKSESANYNWDDLFSKSII